MWPPQMQAQQPQPGFVPQQLQPQAQGIQYDTSQLPQGGQPMYNPQPGVPGGTISQPLYPVGHPMAQAPQAQQPQQPQQGWPQMSQQQPQQGWPPQAPLAPQQQGQINDNVVLDGPAVPPELRGRTWGDAKRLYQALSTDWLRRQSQVQQFQQPQAQAPQFQHQAPPAQAPSGPLSFQQQQDSRIAQIVAQTVAPMLQPLVQQNQSQAVLQARQIARTGMPDFDYLEPDIMQRVAGASPEVLANPMTWKLAADAARGERVLIGQYRPQMQMQRQMPGPGASVPANGQAPVHTFFSESPSAPAFATGGGIVPRQPTQEDAFYAQRFSMPVQDYMAWKYGTGVQQPNGLGSF